MRLVPPPATVQFGLAAAFGYSSTQVNASATVGLFSELPGTNVLPFWLPDGCAFGPLHADTTNGNGGGPGKDDDDDEPAGDFTLDSMSPASVSVNHSGSLTITASKKDVPAGQQATVRFTSGASQYEAAVSPSVKGSTSTLTVLIGNGNVTASDSTWTVTVTVGATISEPRTLTVGSGGTPADEPEEPEEPLPTTCTGSDRGNFGQMDSPRSAGGLNHQRELGMNIAEGLDHDLYPYRNAGQVSCQSPALPDAQLDDTSRDGNNCITASPGNDGPWIYAGLIDGKNLPVATGRLDVARGATKSGCNGGNTAIGGVTINNDLLSCYLRDGYDLADLTASSGVTHDMLDASIVDSPRFVWLPVVYALDRSRKDFQPILKFVPGMITDETAGDNGTSNATSDNGIQVNGNSVKKLNVFTFNPKALPDSAQSPVMEYDPAFGRETVRLID